MGVTNKILRVQEPGKPCVAANEAVALLRDKWNILILGALAHDERLRYGELQRAVDGISQRMLTLSLKTLEENGLVTRTLFPSIPPRVDYALTPMGRTLIGPLRGLLGWSMENGPAMAEARRAYATKTRA